MTVKPELKPGKATLTLRHGDTERVVKGKIREFEQDGETRWEIETGDEHHPAIGFVPENVISVEG